jgi:hypothetical protein
MDIRGGASRGIEWISTRKEEKSMEKNREGKEERKAELK